MFKFIKYYCSRLTIFLPLRAPGLKPPRRFPGDRMGGLTGVDGGVASSATAPAAPAPATLVTAAVALSTVTFFAGLSGDMGSTLPVLWDGETGVVANHRGACAL